ncbi:hypothetical protein F3J44_29385, partial [Pantoea sp. Tr-811]|nr:hypothetical protein [Pantoea sp. Tr-811]
MPPGAALQPIASYARSYRGGVGLACAVYPDDPHNPAPQPGVDSTLNPIEKPMPRDTDPRIQGDDPENPPAKLNDDRDLPGM